MDELDCIHVFIQAVETGSFSAAGRKLNKSPSSIARQIMWLESDLGVRLLHRSTRSQSLTEAGRIYYERVKALGQNLNQAKSEARSAHEGVEGLLRVSLRISATTVIVPALPKLLSRYPGLQLEIEVTDERKDLIANQIDVAVWVGELPDMEIVARQLSPTRRIVCGSPAYLEKNGSPERPEDLSGHSCLLYRQKSYDSIWTFTRADERIVVPVSGHISTENGLVLISAASNGLGLVLVPEWMVADLMETGRLMRVLPDYTADPVASGASSAPLYAVFPSSRRMSKRVRVFVDFLVELFQTIRE